MPSYPHIPLSELSISFSRSSGPGGQNVNKTATKAHLRWNVFTSQAISPEEKGRIAQVLGSRINVDGEVVVDVDETRSQSQNKALAIARLHALVAHAIVPKKKRRATRPTRASKLKRLEQKRKRGERKRIRRGIGVV